MRRATDYTRYATDPVGYARDVLGVTWWHVQEQIARALLAPPYKVLVLASHSVGKTHLAGGLVNWWFDTRPRSVCVTTAPTDRDVKDLLWKEVRLQRGTRGGFKGPAAAELFESEAHYAKGFTSAKGESFQGRHPEHFLVLFDEAVGVRPFSWTTTRTMVQLGNPKHAWLAIANPTDTSSQMYAEAQSGGWTVIQMAATDHPNVIAELRGEPPPYPSAVRLAQVNEQLRDWCTPIAPADRRATDLEWPPGSGRWLRPGPEAEARVLGRWPSSATYGVWSDSLWAACERGGLDEPTSADLAIGCDVARHGDDWTAIHVRDGGTSLHHERGNGWDTMRTVGRLIELAREYGAPRNLDPQRVPLVIDDTGVGGGVTDRLREQGYRAVPINAAATARQDERYADVRSELWFAAAERAKAGRLDVSRLDRDTRQRLRVQVMAPVWALDSRGRRKVESKAETKARCQGRSPDDADATNLAYYVGGLGAPEVVSAQRRDARQPRRGESPRSPFGRR